jgi:translation initiation factor 1
MSQLGSLVFANTDFDVTAAADDSKTSGDAVTRRGLVHLRIQQRNGKKFVTTIQGLATDLDVAKIIKALKKTYNTNGTVTTDEKLGQIIQLQGDQRQNVFEFFVKYKVCEKDEVKVHGF